MMSSKVYIQNKLNSLAADANVKILLAIESGSRAWGFPSADSDYDVRFVYIRKLDDYLTEMQLAVATSPQCFMPLRIFKTTLLNGCSTLA